MWGYVILLVFGVAVVAYVMSKDFRAWVEGAKTWFTAAMLAALGVLQQGDLTEIIDADHVGYWMLGIAVAMAVLRVLTYGPPKGM